MERTIRSSGKHKEQIVPSIDRLSGLPDVILCHILSFLPTKLTVATSILARRWRFLWSHVPNLAFNECDYKTDLNVNKGFFDILYRVMLQYRVQNMNTFRLACSDNNSEYQLETCIIAAIVRNVKNLYLDLDSLVDVPSCLFNCKTLVDLSLHVFDDIPMTVCLLALKKLRLHSLKYVSDESLPRMLSGCPVFEELIVDEFVDHPSMSCCCICSPTLKSLVLMSHFYLLFFGSDNPYRVKIDTPALRYLQLHDFISQDFSVGSLTSLIEADVIFDYDAPADGEVLHSRSVLEFVGRLCNVKCLKLSTSWMKVPNSTFSALTVRFHNLTELELAVDWRFLSYFFENADNLEVLNIHKVDIDLSCWIEPHQVPTCLLSHLRTVRIYHLGCTEQELNMVKYFFLRNAKVMERLEVYSQDHEIDLKAKLNALRKISLFRQGSEACELAFY
ncbi:hypothetical protein DH2020_027107 [Rehmannia glutinosa]|uniref:FBD domain-containing protein n=1 Tax=Rehmannia glutinosa TaxID=99300 RepID=A0ABR0VWU9_REHGL